MGRIKVVFTQRDGSQVAVSDAESGNSLMQVARDNGVDGILGECGGSCACATCHVYVAPRWQGVVGGPDVLEEMTLDGVAHITRADSRLGCQIVLNDAMDGLEVTVAPAQ